MNKRPLMMRVMHDSSAVLTTETVKAPDGKSLDVHTSIQQREGRTVAAIVWDGDTRLFEVTRGVSRFVPIQPPRSAPQEQLLHEVAAELSAHAKSRIESVDWEPNGRYEG